MSTTTRSNAAAGPAEEREKLQPSCLRRREKTPLNAGTGRERAMVKMGRGGALL